MIPTELIRYKQMGRAITVLTAWDSLSAALVEAAGVDVVLVGDSLKANYSVLTRRTGICPSLR